MQLQTNSKKPLMFFVSDVPRGWLIQCSECNIYIVNQEFNRPFDPNKTDGTCVCNNCGTKLYYPDGASW